MRFGDPGSSLAPGESRVFRDRVRSLVPGESRVSRDRVRSLALGEARVSRALRITSDLKADRITGRRLRRNAIRLLQLRDSRVRHNSALLRIRLRSEAFSLHRGRPHQATAAVAAGTTIAPGAAEVFRIVPAAGAVHRIVRVAAVTAAAEGNLRAASDGGERP